MGREIVDAEGKIGFFFFSSNQKRQKLIKTNHIFSLVPKLLKVGFEFHSAI